jgi:hypothetical protein
MLIIYFTQNHLVNVPTAFGTIRLHHPVYWKLPHTLAPATEAGFFLLSNRRHTKNVPFQNKCVQMQVKHPALLAMPKQKHSTITGIGATPAQPET